jgi:SAM-dependent methyltransferase
MNDDLRDKWDRRWRDSASTPRPLAVLADNIHLLPSHGHALDLACGLGGNALLLAEHGLETWAWDLSPVGIERLREEAVRRELVVHPEVRDVLADPPGPERFDVITVGHFLDRRLVPALTAALKPGGLLYYQTFTRERVDDTGPQDDAFRLEENELLRLFADLTLIHYREEGRIGDLTKGLRNEAQLIAIKK